MQNLKADVARGSLDVFSRFLGVHSLLGCEFLCADSSIRN